MTVEYALTPLGLTEPLTALADWARTHRADVLSARRAYDVSQGSSHRTVNRA